MTLLFIRRTLISNYRCATPSETMIDVSPLIAKNDCFFLVVVLLLSYCCLTVVLLFAYCCLTVRLLIAFFDRRRVSEETVIAYIPTITKTPAIAIPDGHEIHHSRYNRQGTYLRLVRSWEIVRETLILKVERFGLTIRF